MTKITKEWLTSQNACEDGVEFVTEKGLLNLDAAEFVEALIKLDKLHWANWLVVRCVDRPNQIRYACFAARDALVAKDHPAYKVSLVAIEAAEACIENDTSENRQKANAAWAAEVTAAALAAVDSDKAYRKYIRYGLKLLKEGGK